MIENRSTASVVNAWRTRAESSLEQQTTPFFDLGAGDSLAVGLIGVRALHCWEQARDDVTEPLALVGGSSALWLSTLLQRRATGNALPLTVAFAGADRATYMASTATWGRSGGWGPRIDGALSPPHLPYSHLWALQPVRLPGAAVAWSTLPVLSTLTEPRRESPRSNRVSTAAVERAVERAVEHTTDSWVTLGAVLTAVLLVLAALIL